MYIREALPLPSGGPSQGTSPSMAVPLEYNPYESNGKNILTITGVMTSFALLAVVARLYVRGVMLKSVGTDDYLMILSMACSIAVFVCLIMEVSFGDGMHINSPKLLANLSIITEWSYHHAWVIVLGITTAKMSVGFFLLRLVQGKLYKRSLYAFILFLVVFMLASIGALIFQCLPVEAAWNFALRLDPKTKCYSTEVFRSIGLFNGSINILTDFVFATLPIPIILPLQITTRTKVTLICILSLGYFACAASIVKEVLLANFFNNPDPFFSNSFQIWNDIELNAAILAACLPSLRPLFSWLLDAASDFKTNMSMRSGRHKYTMQDDNNIAIKMESLGNSTQDSNKHGINKDGYDYNISAGSKGDGRTLAEDNVLRRQPSGPMSRLEQSIAGDDSESERGASPTPMPRGRHEVYVTNESRRQPRKGILRTTEVTIS